MSDIPKSVARASREGDIPKLVTGLPQDVEAPESRPYLISFSKYNEKLCEIAILSSNKARKAIETLKIIGTKVHSSSDFQSYNIDRIPIRQEGVYRRLFNGLSCDIELKELKLQQDARIFYFDIEPERTFYVVAITENHYEIDKVRR